MAYWNPVRTISEPIPIRSFSGVYKPKDEGFNLSDSFFTELINFSPDEYPAITTRRGYTVVGAFGGGVLGLGAWKGTELHAVFKDGVWRRLNADGTWTELASGLSKTAEWTFCNFRGNLGEINLIAANGVDPIKRYNGNSVTNLANAPSRGNFITTHSNRLYCAVDNFLVYSALNKADDWTTVDDAGEIAVDTTDGEHINGLSAGNGYVTIFKPSTMFELYGKGPQSYAIHPIAADIGATGNKSVVVYDDTLMFIGRDGIYRYSGGIRPKRDFSQPVQGYVDDSVSMHRCVSGSDGQYIYFYVPYDGGRILQYDPHHRSWYTWDGINATHMIRVGDDLYIGDDQGRVLKLGGDDDNGNMIESVAITKPFTADSISRKQHWFSIWIVASIEQGSSLSVYISGNDEEWKLAKTLVSETNMQFKRILIPTNAIAKDNKVRLKIVAVGRVTIHEITRQLRELPMRR